MKSDLLWAPWRMGYIIQVRGKKKKERCLFCALGRSPKQDLKNLVVIRGKHCFSVLNRYPYNNGHMMVAAYRHNGELGAMTEPEIRELFKLTDDSIKRLRKLLDPEGFNLGWNMGRGSGAGFPGHLHLHIVPRWTGDTNFMPVLANTKVISQSLGSACRLLRKTLPAPRL